MWDVIQLHTMSESEKSAAEAVVQSIRRQIHAMMDEDNSVTMHWGGGATGSPVVPDDIKAEGTLVCWLNSDTGEMSISSYKQVHFVLSRHQRVAATG